MATQPNQAGDSRQGFRLNVLTNEALMSPRPRAVPAPPREPQSLPQPVYPQVPAEQWLSDKEYYAKNRNRALQAWAVPFFQSRWHRTELRPIIAYLFTDYKCNLDCHYCWAYDNRVKGMTEDMAKRSIDWLHSIGCRVLALLDRKS